MGETRPARCSARARWLPFVVVTSLALVACTPFRDSGAPGQDAGEADASEAQGVCSRDSDCPAADPCTPVLCEDLRGKNACVLSFTEDGVALPDELQVEGDCKTLLCDGEGNNRVEIDDRDTGGGGNPCQMTRCENGTGTIMNAPDGSPCNEGGKCQDGNCDKCTEGNDCTLPNNCTVHRSVCEGGKFSCVDTGIPRTGRACELGKVCSEGSCVPCVLGAECDTGSPCYFGRITSCQGRLECEPQPQSGLSCGTDSMGRTMYCVAGLCTTPCREGPCMSAPGPCQTSHWDCSSSTAAPVCLPVPKSDGEACDEQSVCHAGACITPSLVNGDFTRGLEGWDVSGDGASFLVMPGTEEDGRATVSTSPTSTSTGSATRGSIAQSFMVQDDVIALRFYVFGGQARVRLKDASGAVVEECTGTSSSEDRVPVSWDLSGRRGQRLTLAIEDDLGSGEWGFVGVSAFDVIRDVPVPLHNAQWSKELVDWSTTGDASYFNVFDDYNRYGSDAYGRRISLSTYVRNRASARQASAGQGNVSQSFLVPSDAVALRFNLHGGGQARVTLEEAGSELFSATANGSDIYKKLVSWNLEALRNKTVRITIRDDQTSEPYGYIGVTGFDLITSYNGP